MNVKQVLKLKIRKYYKRFICYFITLKLLVDSSKFGVFNNFINLDILFKKYYS